MVKEKSFFKQMVESFRVTDEQRKVIELKIKKLKIGIKILWPFLIVFSCILVTSLFKTDFKADFTNSFWGFILASSFILTYWSTIFLISGYKDIRKLQWDLKRDSVYDNMLSQSISDLPKEDNQKPA